MKNLPPNSTEGSVRGLFETYAAIASAPVSLVAGWIGARGKLMSSPQRLRGPVFLQDGDGPFADHIAIYNKGAYLTQGHQLLVCFQSCLSHVFYSCTGNSEPLKTMELQKLKRQPRRLLKRSARLFVHSKARSTLPYATLKHSHRY